MKNLELLFINKDARSHSLSQSSAKEKSSINAHVQRGLKHVRRNHHPKLDLTSRPQYQFRFRQSSESDLSSSQDESPSPDLEGGTHSISRLNIPIRQSNETAQTLRQKQERERQMQIQRSERNLLAKQICGEGDAIDPFSACCVKLDRQAHVLLQYYQTVSHPNTWHMETKAKGRYRFRMDAVSIIRDCLNSELNLYCLLASMASQMTCLERASLQRDPSYYIHKALIATQEHVKTKPAVDGWMLLNIFQLGCAEWYRYNHEAALVHLKVVKTLSDQLGGLSELNPSLKEMILLGDGYVSAEVLMAPVFPPSFDPGLDTIVAEWLETIPGIEFMRGRFGNGLLCATQEGIVPEELGDIVRDLAECVTILKASSLSENAPPATLRWVHLRNLAIRHRLLAMISSDVKTQVLRAAIIMWIMMTLTVTGRKRSMRIIAPKLQALLFSIEHHQWRSHEAVLLWVLSIGAMSATTGSAAEEWFVDEIVWLLRCRLAVYADEEVVEEALLEISRSFFYLEGIQGPMVRNLAIRISERTKAWSLQNRSLASSLRLG